MRKIKYDGKGTTVCPWGMTSFAGGAKIVGSLGCMNCVNHAGQSYTADGGVVSCLNSAKRRDSGYRGDSANSANSSYRAEKVERAKRATKTDGPNGADGSDGKTKAKRVTKKVSKNNNTKIKKEEKK